MLIFDLQTRIRFKFTINLKIAVKFGKEIQTNKIKADPGKISSYAMKICEEHKEIRKKKK